MVFLPFIARRNLLHSPPAIKRCGPEVRRILTLPPERRSPTRQVFKPPLNAPDRKSALRGASRAGGSVKKPPEVRTGRTGLVSALPTIGSVYTSSFATEVTPAERPWAVLSSWRPRYAASTPAKFAA